MHKSKFLILYSLILIAFTIYVLLDTFVLTSSYEVASSNDYSYEQKETGDITSTDNSYEDDNIKINIKEYRENDTNVYVADVYIEDINYLKTAFASNTYGKNVTDKTSDIAEDVNAILAINGDYYGVQEKGYVLKNGKIYRNSSSGKDDLVIYENGMWEIINEDDISLEELLNKGAYNILSFGPSLIKNSTISVTTSDEVAKSMRSNPRTAVGKISTNHYVFVVSDGRTSESAGLTLYELANFMKSLGCTYAYNLDGGGSSTMYFNGNVVNNPTTNGNRINERSVSDIVYIGY